MITKYVLLGELQPHSLPLVLMPPPSHLFLCCFHHLECSLQSLWLVGSFPVHRPWLTSYVFPHHTPHIAARPNALSEDIYDGSVQTPPMCNHELVLIYLMLSPYQDSEAWDLTGAQVPLA